MYTKAFKGSLTASIVFLILTAGLHSLSLFTEQTPRNDQEKVLIDITTQYKADLGGGMFRSYSELFTALSSCFSLLCLLGGLLLWYFMRKNVDKNLLAGTLNIFILVFGVMFAIMACLTFWPPIICSACIFMGILVSRMLLFME